MPMLNNTHRRRTSFSLKSLLKLLLDSVVCHSDGMKTFSVTIKSPMGNHSIYSHDSTMISICNPTTTRPQPLHNSDKSSLLFTCDSDVMVTLVTKLKLCKRAILNFHFFDTQLLETFILIDSERSDECIDFTMIRNNAPIPNFGGGFRCKSEYPWCIMPL
ncbi:Uncharacterized protein FWK35_00002377 [Aphis craccivora]|uniref:Uncharacterized protein n=1 Tax=Aphis craccivora TaxID=307492 RepID=A0A6G0Z8F0_APHCR|nr:Uncharacterized protein FWK35_00002377 [Aphis craccivora]